MAMEKLISGLEAGAGNFKKATLILHDTAAKSASPANVAGAAKRALSAAASGVSAAASISQSSSAGMEVQYNPSSLSIQANANQVPFSSLLKNTDDGVPSQELRPPAITLSVQLIFDDMNPKDAFLEEKFRLSAGKMVSDAAAARMAETRHYSVQSQTNGLVAMLMRNSTRVVTFHWADLSFTGEVFQVQARYTMFSLSGQPIRSTVDLVIVQEILNDGVADRWDQAFDRCFSDTLDAGLGESIQKASHLIDISNFK